MKFYLGDVCTVCMSHQVQRSLSASSLSPVVPSFEGSCPRDLGQRGNQGGRGVVVVVVCQPVSVARPAERAVPQALS